MGDLNISSGEWSGIYSSFLLLMDNLNHKMLRFTGIVMLLIVCKSVTTVRADTIPDRYVGFQANYGFIIPHSASIEAISDTRPFGFEISFNKLHTSYNKWKTFNAYWSSGIQAGYFNYQNPEVLGSVYLLTVYAEPVVTFTKRFQLAIRTGTGLSYHTRIYDEVENPTNLFFSTRISFPVYVDLRLKYRVGGHTFITLTGCYNHISNGGFKQPNKGMNFPTISAGAEYFFHEVPLPGHSFKNDLKVPRPGIYYTIQFLTTIKILEKTSELPEQRVFVYGFHSRIAKQLTRFYSLNIGAEMIFDGYIRGTIERENSGLDYKRISLTAGQDFLFGKVSFTQYFGYYVYSPYKARNDIYQKYEVAYKAHPHIIVGVFLKAHLQVAELSGITLSWVADWKNEGKGGCGKEK